MYPTAIIQSPSPASLFGSAISGNDMVVEAKALPTHIVPPVPTVIKAENDLKNNPLIDKTVNSFLASQSSESTQKEYRLNTKPRNDTLGLDDDSELEIESKPKNIEIKNLDSFMRELEQRNGERNLRELYHQQATKALENADQLRSSFSLRYTEDIPPQDLKPVSIVV